MLSMARINKWILGVRWANEKNGHMTNDGQEQDARMNDNWKLQYICSKSRASEGMITLITKVSL